MTDDQAREIIELLRSINERIETLVQQSMPKEHHLSIHDRGTPEAYKTLLHAVSHYANPALKPNVGADSVERFGKRTGI